MKSPVAGKVVYMPPAPQKSVEVKPAAGFAFKDWDRAPVRIEKLADLVFDWSLYPRKEIDQRVVENYARALDAGCVFPTLKVGVFKGQKILVDGVHRFSSRKLRKVEYAECSELPFSSEAELFAEAVRLNSGHGKGFSDVELKDNIARLKKFKFDVKDIVALVHVPAAEIYRESAAPIVTLTAPCGKRFHVDSKNGKVQPGLSGRELVELKNALVLFCSLAESGRFPLDDPVIKELVNRAHLDFERLRFHV